MPVWFEGSNEIDCTIEQVKNDFDNYGRHCVGVISLMPGMTSVELLEEGNDFAIIKTNEGLMKRENISKHVKAGSFVIEFEEEYKAGTVLTAASRFQHKFTAGNTGVSHYMIIEDLKAPGFLGFFYRNFGSSRMGNAFLKAYKTYLERQIL